jgi:hypothetical protein
VLTKEAQDLAKPNILSSSGILVTNFQSPFLSFYSNDFEFFPVSLGQELVLVSFLDFLTDLFLTLQGRWTFGGEKVKKEMKGISNAHWAAEVPSCQEQGLGHTHQLFFFFFFPVNMLHEDLFFKKYIIIF